MVARLCQKFLRLSVPPKSVVKFVESTRTKHRHDDVVRARGGMAISNPRKVGSGSITLIVLQSTTFSRLLSR
jgi:hypothetical protein